MARCFVKVSEEEIEEAFFYPSDLVNKYPPWVSEERWIYTSMLCVSVHIHHYSPPLRGIVVCYQWRGDKSVLFTSANYTGKDAAGRGKGFK